MELTKTENTVKHLYKEGSSTKIEYIVYPSKNPGKILVVSGLHGNEGGIIDPLHKYIESHASELPTIIYIPRMSPSALAKNERNNGKDNDLNRIFGGDLGYVDDEERDLIVKIVEENGPYDLVASFHEDVKDPFASFYETGVKSEKLQLDEWRESIKDIGLDLLNDMDDETDPKLRYIFEDGYNYEMLAKDSGTFEHWVIMQNFTHRCLTIESPSIATLEQKQKEIEAIFSRLIIPDFSTAEK